MKFAVHWHSAWWWPLSVAFTLIPTIHVCYGCGAYGIGLYWLCWGVYVEVRKGA